VDGVDGLDSIDPDLHECVIFEKSYFQNNEESMFDETAFFEGKRYELRVVTGVTLLPSAMKYHAYIYSRHGGCHTKWWLQERKKTVSIPIQVELGPVLKPNAEHTAVYIRCQNNTLTDISKELLRYIGGQTHIVCGKHKIPMIPVPDRKLKCRCGRNEHLRCPDLDCSICICDKCADNFDINIINEVHQDNAGISTDDTILLSPTASYNEDDLEDNNNSNFESNDEFDEDNDSIDSNGDDVHCSSGTTLEREGFDDFVTRGIPDAFGGYDSDDSIIINDQGNEGGSDLHIPTTDAGDLPFEIQEENDIAQTRGMSISGHVILNFVGTLLTRQRHQFKTSSIHKYFLQRLVATTIGDSISLLYPEGMLFPCIFWLMKEGSLVGAIPATLLSENTNQFGFASIPQHIRARLTSAGYQTSTNDRYISWCYDSMTNLATNKHDTRMVVNKGLTASQDESGGLNLRGGNNESPLLDAVDSKQMIKNLMSSQKYHPFDMFLTFTCNMKEHFGTKPIKEWIDGDLWKRNFPDYHHLNSSQQLEIKNALNQAAAPLLLRAWNESCRIFLDYLKKSPSSPFKNVDSIFARHEFQSTVGNLPHIHAMLKVKWENLSQEERECVNDCIRASVLDIVRVDEVQRHVDEGLFKHPSDLKNVIDIAMAVLPHKCNPRCLVMTGPNKFTCRKPNYLLMNPQPGNTHEKYVDLPNSMSIESLRQLEKVGIIEPIHFDKQMDYMKSFKSRLPYFHPKRHIPPINWTHDMNISPVEGYTFAHCLSMQNIQKIIHSGGCSKYIIKYIGKIDAQNYVIVYTNGQKNGQLVTKGTFLHNTKLSSSKKNEEQALEKKKRGKSSNAIGRAISLTEMLHNMLKYSEVATDLNFIDIATTSLEVRLQYKIESMKKATNNIEDGAEVGNECNNARIEHEVPQWRRFTDSQLLILRENKASNRASLDMISAFSIRVPELSSCFDKVGSYYRWFKIDKRSQRKEALLELLSPNIRESSWIDGQGHITWVRRKAISEVMAWLEDVIAHDPDYNDVSNGKQEIVALFQDIHHSIQSNTTNDELESRFVFNDDMEEHLPVPVFSYIRPTMGTQFILHILLSLGRYKTEMDLLQHRSLRESFRYARLIGPEDDNESLQRYSNKVFVQFIEEQLIFFPNSRSIIDSWITITADLLNEAIKNDTIPITDMPAVQQTTLMKSIDENCIKYVEKLKKEAITSACKELNNASQRCNIPTINDLINATKENPLDWDGFESFQEASAAQNDESFREQKNAIKICTEVMNEYANIFQNAKMQKSCTIQGYAGCGKSWCMQYCLIHCFAKGLFGLPTSVMSRRSVFLGSKHLDHMFSLPFDKKGMSPYRIAELAISRLQRFPEKINLLRILDVLFLDEIGQLPAEMLSTIDIILRRVCNTDIFMGGVIIISTMDHTQLQPINGRPFLLSTHVLTCFKMVKLRTSVRASGDMHFQRLQAIIRMHHSQYIEHPELLDELRVLLRNVPTYVPTWTSPQISTDTYRLYGRRTPANEATQIFVDTIRANIQNEVLREKAAVDTQRLRLSHIEWASASLDTSKKLDRKVKEPSTILFFKGALYEFTYNKDNEFSQGQMALLYDIPDQQTVAQGRKVKVLAAPTGLHDIQFDESKSKDDYLAMGFYEVQVGIAPIRTQAISRYLQGQRKQYALKHRVTSTIHASMGDTLNKVAMQITDAMFELWDKAQIIVALTRTKLGRNVIFVGDIEETSNAIIQLIQTKSQWTDYMENILNFITISNDNPNNQNTIPTLNQDSFPFRICDISLPQCKTGFVYFLISIRTRNFTYIGECKCIVTRLYHHNSGHGSTSTIPANRRPFAIMGYICGFDGQNKPLQRQLERQWKERRDFLISEGIDDPRLWFRAGRYIIDELDNDVYQKEKTELRLVELFK
jgi:hypothetical protein